MRSAIAVAAAALATGVAASNDYMGFNSGSTKTDGTPKVKADFVSEFTTAQKLAGTNGKFNSMRLYTNIQAGAGPTDPIEAFEAAVETKTNLLLGIWASGTDSIANELSAVKNAINSVKGLQDIVIGMSIGSEDLYRDGATGQQNKAGVGAGPETIVKFIQDYKSAVKGTVLENVPVGHVDTWDAWTNGTNAIVINEIDWLGVDEYPYYESTEDNTISNGLQLFNQAYLATQGVAGGKPVWVTETGWPYEGITWNKAVPSVSNAKQFYQQVGCGELFGQTPTFWYNLEDTNPDNKQLFAIYDPDTNQPRWDLSCGSIKAKLPTAAAPSSTSALPSSTGSSSGSTGSSSGSTSTGASAPAATTTGSSSSSGSDASTTTGSASAPTTTNAGVAQSVPKIAYAGLAIAAGLFAML